MNVFKSAVTSIICSAVITVSIGNYYYQQSMANLESALEGRPQVAVINLGKLMESIPSGTTPEEVKAIMKELESSSTKLAEAGFLVITSSPVFAGGADITINVQDIISRGLKSENAKPLVSAPDEVASRDND